MARFAFCFVAGLSLMCALNSAASAQLIIGHRGASHDAPENTIDRLRDWAAVCDGWMFTVDDSIAPVRWTVIVDY